MEHFWVCGWQWVLGGWFYNSSQLLMDKTFNFFKSKPRKDNDKHRHHSKSNSSKASCSKHSDKAMPALQKQPLTKREREIREAIEIRYQKSKMRLYQFTRRNEGSLGRPSSSRSVEMEEFKNLKKKGVVDLKDYHSRRDGSVLSAHSSQEKKKFAMKFKFRDSGNSAVMKTEGNEPEPRASSALSSKAIKRVTPSRVSKKTEEWKFISIQMKEDLSKPKNRKTEVKINSHRSYNVQQEKAPKMKSNSSMNKYLDRPKSKEPTRLTKSRF